MKIIIAPDSMKECLSAAEVAACISDGVEKVFPLASLVRIPMADGGEGTAGILTESTGGVMVQAEACDPLMRPVSAFYGILGDGKTAVIETAAASGLALLKKEERNPLITSSYGTGQLIRHALDRGCRNFIIGLGGSAVNDAGAGLLRALGAEVRDEKGNRIGEGGAALLQAKEIDLSGLDVRMKACRISIACDVDHPLTGPAGASAVFGPQKGADAGMVALLDKALGNYALLLDRIRLQDVALIPGTGAAGGMAASLLTFFDTTLKPGFELVSETVQLEQKAEGAICIFTAEGKTDFQTLGGKVPAGMAAMGKKLGIPVFILAGALGEKAESLLEKGATALIPVTDRPVDLATSIIDAPRLLTAAAERVCRILRAGLEMKH